MCFALQENQTLTVQKESGSFFSRDGKNDVTLSHNLLFHPRPLGTRRDENVEINFLTRSF